MFYSRKETVCTMEQVEIPAGYDADIAFVLGNQPRNNPFILPGDVFLVKMGKPNAEVQRVIVSVGLSVFPAIYTAYDGCTPTLYPMNGSKPIPVRSELDAVFMGRVVGVIPAESAQITAETSTNGKYNARLN